MDFRDVGQVIRDYGIDSVILPFFLVFVIVYAVLEKTRILGEENNHPKRNLNAMVALVFGLVFVSYLNLVVAVEKILPYSALALLIIIMIGLVLGTLGINLSDINKPWLRYLLGVVILIIFGIAFGFLQNVKISSLLDYISHPVVIVASIFILVIWFIVRDENDKKIGSGENVGGEKKGSDKSSQVRVTRDDVEKAGKGMKPGESKEI